MTVAVLRLTGDGSTLIIWIQLFATVARAYAYAALNRHVAAMNLFEICFG